MFYNKETTTAIIIFNHLSIKDISNHFFNLKNHNSLNIIKIV